MKKKGAFQHNNNIINNASYENMDQIHCNHMGLLIHNCLFSGDTELTILKNKKNNNLDDCPLYKK